MQHSADHNFEVPLGAVLFGAKPGAAPERVALTQDSDSNIAHAWKVLSLCATSALPIASSVTVWAHNICNPSPGEASSWT